MGVLHPPSSDGVRQRVGVIDGVSVRVGVGVLEGVKVIVAWTVLVLVGVRVWGGLVGVLVAVSVAVGGSGVFEGVDVLVLVGVIVAVGTRVFTAVAGGLPAGGYRYCCWITWLTPLLGSNGFAHHNLATAEPVCS